MDQRVSQATWSRSLRVTLRRMALVWAGPPVAYFLMSGLGEPGPDGRSGKYDLRLTAIVAAGAATYAGILAVPDHLLARRGRPAVVAVHVGYAALAVAIFSVFTAVHTWVAVVASIFLMALAGALAFAGVVLLNLMPGSFPPTPAQSPSGPIPPFPADGASH